MNPRTIVVSGLVFVLVLMVIPYPLRVVLGQPMVGDISEGQTKEVVALATAIVTGLVALFSGGGKD